MAGLPAARWHFGLCHLGMDTLVLEQTQDDEEGKVIPWLHQCVTVKLVPVHWGGDIEQALELQACCQAGIQVFFQRVMIKVDLHPCLSHTPVGDWLACVKVIANMTTYHKGIGIIHREYQTTTGFHNAGQRGEKAFVVRDVIEHKMAD